MLQRFWENQNNLGKISLLPIQCPNKEMQWGCEGRSGVRFPPLGPVSLGKSFSYFGTLTPSPIFPKNIAASPIFQK